MSHSVVELSREVAIEPGVPARMRGNVQYNPSPSIQTSNESSPLLVKKNKKSLPNSHGDVASGEIRTYWWRWVVLLVFLLNSTVNNALWITFAPVADVMRCYYNIDNSLVNTLSIASAVITVLLTIPSAWMLVRFGLRFTIVLGSFATALGGALRLIGAGSKYFGFLIAGQLVSSFNGLQTGATTLLSETWFSPSERVTATAISASIAPQVGVLISYALSPTILHRNDTLTICNTSNNSQNGSHTPHNPHYPDWQEDMYQRIFYYLLGQAIISVLIFFLTIFAFPNAPPTPPSLSRKLESGARASDETTCDKVKSFLISLLEFMRIPPFVLFLFAAGINIGVSGAVVALLDELVNPYFPIAYLGITAQVASILALILTGRLLDITKAFYVMCVLVYALAIASILVFTLLLQFNGSQRVHFYTLYVPVGFIGASVTSFQVIALEYAVEMTYPLPEGTSAGLINLFGLTMATALIAGVGKLHKQRMYIGAWIITALTIVGGFLVVFVRPELKRLKIDSAKGKLIQTPKH